jgi:magnesium transporter
MNHPAQGGVAADLLPANVVAGEPKDIAAILTSYRAADAAEVLNSLDRHVAARVLEAMPVPAAVQIFNESHLEQSAKLIELMPVDCAPAILTGVHPDRRADIFRQLEEGPRQTLKARLPEPMRQTLEHLLS